MMNSSDRVEQKPSTDDDTDGEWDSDDEMVTEDELAYEKGMSGIREPESSFNTKQDRQSTRFFSLARLNDETKRKSFSTSLPSPPVERRTTPRLAIEEDKDDDTLSTLDQQLRALFFTIKLSGVAACRDSQLQLKGAKIEAEIRERGAQMTELELIHRFNSVVDEAISLEKARRKGIQIGWANEVALERFKALDALKRKQILTNNNELQNDDEFILMADLAASLRENGVKIDMNEVKEVWELLAFDCNSPDPLKLTFFQFHSWLYQWHPQLQGAKRIILASFVSTDAFIKEFKFHSIIIDRLIQARHKKKQEAQAKQYSFRFFDLGLACVCNFSPCKSAWSYLEAQTTSQLARGSQHGKTSPSRSNNTVQVSSPSRYIEYS